MFFRRPEVSSTGRVAFGEGGVDDSEDLEVVLHELGHGIHDWVTNGQISQVDGLSEGSGDYWAASYTRSLGFWQPTDTEYNWVMCWDGHNTFWAGRIVNYSATYPGGLTGSIHTDGQMWSSTLMQIWNDIGKTATDENFLEALSMLNSGSSQNDAANVFYQAELALHGGVNQTAILSWFNARGYTISTGAPPNAPTSLTATAVSSSQINLAWTQNSSDETGFKIERKTGAAGTYAEIAIVGANVTSYSNTSLSAGTTYFYRVRAYNLFFRINFSGLFRIYGHGGIERSRQPQQAQDLELKLRQRRDMPLHTCARFEARQRERCAHKGFE